MDELLSRFSTILNGDKHVGVYLTDRWGDKLLDYAQDRYASHDDVIEKRKNADDLGVWGVGRGWGRLTRK
jgi:hypothetical protein